MEAGLKVYVCSFLLFILPLACGCTAATVNYRRMMIDPDSLRVSFSGQIRSGNPAEPFYFLFHMSDGRLQVTHYAANPAEKPEIYNFFFVGPDGALVYREKRQQLMAGPFGRVYGKITYFYAAIYGNQPASLETALYTNNLAYETPKIEPSLPPEAGRLDAISVARILRGGPEYLVASANYAADGSLVSISVNGSKAGDWVHSNDVQPADGSFRVGTIIGDHPTTRMHFGLPSRFPVDGYRLHAGSVFSSTPYEVVLDAIHFHFNRGRWVQQDLAPPGGPSERKFLEFAYTSDDAALDLVDSRRAFVKSNP
jgi:hypothetical protein